VGRLPVPAQVRIGTVSPLSNEDQFIPGLGVDASTDGADTRLALAYYAYEDADCRPTACRLDVWTTHSTSSGAAWSPPERVNSTPMQMDWVPGTSSGFMVGDYVSTSFLSNGEAIAVVPIAGPPEGSRLDLAMYAVTGL
jgi:hypothetical protein